ncbi:MAG: hypothetical protein C0608_00820 [Deltaproteobacteria bacterium]|nr:MAG: hypothetical protein C0608_00820 [Deltaproteobacteria bacterium]
MSEEKTLSVGEKIKEVREAKGLTLQELAEKSGYTSALVNQIENHLESPPLGALGKIAHALGVDIGELWGDHGDAPYAIARKKDRRPVNRFASKEGVSYGYSYESLGMGMGSRHIEPFIVTLEPPTVNKTKPSCHEGEEFLYVLNGKLEIELDGHKDILEPGDSIQYSAKVPHSLSAVDGKTAQLLAVVWSQEQHREDG